MSRSPPRPTEDGQTGRLGTLRSIVGLKGRVVGEKARNIVTIENNLIDRRCMELSLKRKGVWE